MKYIFLLISFLYIYLDSTAQNQSSCSTAQKLMTEATKIENEKNPNYGNAIRKLYSAQIAARDCSPAKEMEVKERIIHLFEKIEKLRVAAEEAKNKAVASEQKAQIATINATALFWASEAKKYNSIQGLQFVKKAMSTAKSENTIQSIKETTASIFNNGFVDKFTLIKSKTYLPKANIKDIGIITAPSFSKDGRWMIVHYSESPYYRILNVPGLNGFNPLEKEYYISSYFFSDDCKWLLTKSANQPNELKYKLWNLQKGKSQIFTYKGEQINTLKFSSDGKWLTTTDIMDMSLLWDLNSNKGYLLPSDIININFSSDCKWIITSSNDNEYKLYNLNGEIIPRFLSNNTYNFISITDDCKWLITKNNDDVYKLWNINTQEEATFISIGDSIPIVALSSENKWLIAKYENGHCRVWDLSNMQFDDFLKNEIDIVNTKFSVDGSILINFHANNQNKVWNLKNKKAFDFLQNEIGITYAEADSNFNYLVTTDGKKTIKVWDIKGKKQRLEGLSIYKYRFSDYGTLLLQLNNGVQLYEINLKNKIETLFDLSRFNVSNPYSYSYYGISPDFRWIGVVIEGDFSYELWNLKTINEQIKSVFKQEHPVERTQVSSDSKWLVTTDINYTAKVWSVEKEIQANFLKEEATIHEANFSPDSKWLVITDANLKDKVWSMEKEKQADFLREEKNIDEATFSPDSKWLVTTSSNHTAKVWSVEKEILHDFLKEEKNIDEATFSPDSKWLVTTYSEYPKFTAKVWSTEKEILHDFLKEEKNINMATFSPDSKWLITRDWNNTAKVWSTEKEIQAGFLKEEATINHATFSPDSKWLVTRYSNKTAKVWSTEKEIQANFLKEEKNIDAATFSPDSKWLVTKHGEFPDYTAKVWSVEKEILHDFLKEEATIRDATFSPDSKLLSIITKHQVKTYETATGKLIQWVWLNKIPKQINILDNRYLYVTVGKAIVKTDLETQQGNLMSYGDGEKLDYEYDEIVEWKKVFGKQYLLPLDEEIKQKYGIKD